MGAPGALLGGVAGDGAWGRGCAGTDMPGVSRSNNCVNSLARFVGGGAGGSGRGVSGSCGGITASKRGAPGSGESGGALFVGLGADLAPNTSEKLPPALAAGGLDAGGVGACGVSARGVPASGVGGGGVGALAGAGASALMPPKICVKPSPPFGGSDAGSVGEACGGLTVPNTSLKEGATGGAAGASGDATADGAKIAVKPASVFGAAGDGATGATFSLGLAGPADITSVFASFGTPFSRIHDGKSVKVVRKRVTTVVVPSTS